MKEIILGNSNERKMKGSKPVIINWGKRKNGEKAYMVRGHSIRAVANEIKNMSSNQDLISINVIGKQSTGKTELCKTIAHLVHQMAEEEYMIKIIGRNEFVNLEQTAAELKPVNHILIFDDIAFLKAGSSARQIEQIQYILSVIRHLPGGKDVRIIIFKSFQYSKALPPFLRQNDCTFVSSVDDAEIKGLADTMGVSNTSKIKLLKRMSVELKKGSAGTSVFHFPLSQKSKTMHKYYAKDPFLPYLYYDGINARIIVSPLRTWIDPICPICDGFGDEANENIQANFEEFRKDLEEKFDKKYPNGIQSKIHKKALQIVLLRMGVNTLSPRMNQCIKFIELWMQQTKFPKEKLMEGFGFKEHRVRTKTPNFEKVRKEVNPLKEVDDT